MRAIHINPWNKSITEIDLDDDGDGCIAYEALRAAVFHGRPSRQHGYIDRIHLGNGVDAWVDEDGFMIPWDEQRFCALHPPGLRRLGQSAAGHVILTGTDGWGSSLALPSNIIIELVQASVTWLDAREVTCPALKIYSVDPETGVKTLIEDQGTWTYENQPT
jgi:hypothetical protein